MASMQKRKRESTDMAGGRPAPVMDFETPHYMQHDDDDGMDNTEVDFDAAFGDQLHDAAVQVQVPDQNVPAPPPPEGEGQTVNDTAVAAMAQYHTMTVPQSTEQSFMTQQRAEGGERSGEATAEAGDSGVQRTGSIGDLDAHPPQTSADGETSPGKDDPSMTPSRGGKPPVGTEEWHKIRKDNHKEVERRRRETINEGINELAKIVPGCEKNKGSILGRAVQFITQLKENETQNIEKWTLEKLLTEQAIAELSGSVDKLKAECQRAWAECEAWKKAAREAGVAELGKGDAEGQVAE